MPQDLAVAGGCVAGSRPCRACRSRQPSWPCRRPALPCRKPGRPQRGGDDRPGGVELLGRRLARRSALGVAAVRGRQLAGQGSPALFLHPHRAARSDHALRARCRWHPARAPLCRKRRTALRRRAGVPPAAARNHRRHPRGAGADRCSAFDPAADRGRPGARSRGCQPQPRGDDAAGAGAGDAGAAADVRCQLLPRAARTLRALPCDHGGGDDGLCAVRRRADFRGGEPAGSVPRDHGPAVLGGGLRGGAAVPQRLPRTRSAVARDAAADLLDRLLDHHGTRLLRAAAACDAGLRRHRLFPHHHACRGGGERRADPRDCARQPLGQVRRGGVVPADPDLDRTAGARARGLCRPGAA